MASGSLGERGAGRPLGCEPVLSVAAIFRSPYLAVLETRAQGGGEAERKVALPGVAGTRGRPRDSRAGLSGSSVWSRSPPARCVVRVAGAAGHAACVLSHAGGLNTGPGSPTFGAQASAGPGPGPGSMALGPATRARVWTRLGSSAGDPLGLAASWAASLHLARCFLRPHHFTPPPPTLFVSSPRQPFLGNTIRLRVG